MSLNVIILFSIANHERICHRPAAGETLNIDHQLFSPIRIVLAITLVYACGFFFWYSATPLGMVPLLDGKETLHMTEAIHQGTLPAEPFYRAPFYPACLSLLRTVGFSQDWLPLLARLFNGLCHLASTLLIYFIAQKIWQHARAAMTSSLLYGLNPVALHFAADPLDITFAITLLLAAIWFTLKADAQLSNTNEGVSGPSSPLWSALFRAISWPQTRAACLAGLCIGLGTITRPHLLPVACIIPVFLFFKRPATVSLASFAGTLLVLLAFAGTNLVISGQFKLLPTQGAYNLWAANKPGAHGKFFAQSVFIHNQEQHTNPTRLEARALYLQETNATPPINEDTINRYWRSKMFATILENPLTWMRQMAIKTYYLLNNYEQYNNKTYHVHKSISPWLKYNPINWTIMLVLGLAGLLLSMRNRSTRIITGIALAYAAGVLLFFVSARFRLPLVPLLAIFAGGCAMIKAEDVGPFLKKQWAASVVGLLGIGALSLTSFALVDEPNTVVEDYILIARANLQLQDFNAAKHSAEQALLANPNHPGALELVCIAKYNILLDQLPNTPSQESLQQDMMQCLQVSGFSPQAQFNAGVYAHLLGNQTQAQQLWYNLIDQRSHQMQNALAALQFSYALRTEDETLITTLPLTEMETMLLMSEIYTGNEQAKEYFNSLWPEEVKEYHLKIINGLFFRDTMTW